MKIFFLSVFVLISTLTKSQSLQSPEEFLGYEPGKKFTPHYKIVDYFKAAAVTSPGSMKLQQYGLTNEGKELLLAIISSPQNISRLDEIRQNNLRLTGLAPGVITPKAPAIVWLSYNVHGNEASSSEVSMKLLYELLSGKNQNTTQWLNNTVVIIDPCLNPDGRDRYVNWYNQVAGKNVNSNQIAREHEEPWPGGRSNHYNFDLNRDWAWQTQVETRQRLKIYNEWMPAIHCDFHEQYPSNPYYFAPAAEPFHEAITQWQRDFQTTIGKNHAKYFDANGWLYFTKEYFDLFYPAYGDTYPIFNGSIGMTYEQAGHSMAGLGIALDENDTLTLKDRIAHHLTTSLSTIEVAAQYAEKINTEFKKFFDDGINNGNGIYKTYIINGSVNKLSGIKDLFKNNGISYTYTKRGMNVKGYNYFTGKDENYITTENDLLISAYQPKSALIRVLFEPVSKLADSATYDITAWALPYAFGVQAYALRERLAGTGIATENKMQPVATNQYAYLVEYNSFNDGKLLASLLTAGIRVRFAEKNFSWNGKKFNKGTLVILKHGNDYKMGKFIELAQNYNASITPVSSGFMESGFDFGSDKLHVVKKQTVAMLTGEESYSTSSGEVWHFFEQQLDYPIILINAGSVNQANLKDVDVIIIPDGNYKFLTDKDANATLKLWVKQGGKIIAMENAVAQMAAGEWGIKIKKEEEEKPEEKKPSYADIKKYEDREKDAIKNNIPGAIYKLQLDDSHPLAFGYPDYYFSLKLSSNIYEFMKDGWNVGVIKKENQVSGFVGSKAKDKIRDGTVIAVQRMGSGSVIYFADDPIFRSFWESGKLMLINAVFLAGQ